MDTADPLVKFQCFLEEVMEALTFGFLFAPAPPNRTCHYKRREQVEEGPGNVERLWLALISPHFSVGVPDITEDQFFEEFSGISQLQAKKRGQINKEVSCCFCG